MKSADKKFATDVEKQADRIQRAERERVTLLSQTVYLGSLGLMFVLPVVGGAYLGSWLDTKLSGFSMHWTLSLIFLGIFVGAFNVYWMIKTHE